MDIVRIGKHLIDNAASRPPSNGTANGSLPGLPVTLVDAIIPGYSVISHFLNRHLGFDITVVVSFFAICLGIFKGAAWLWQNLQTSFEKHCMSRVYIEDRDDLFEITLKWVIAHKLAATATAVKAKTQTGSAWDEDSDERNSAVAAVDADGHFNYGKWQARVPPRWEPYYGSNRFWHNRHFFKFHRTQKPKERVSFWSDGNDDILELSCVGRSTKPVRDLLQEIKIWSIEEKMSKTSIRHASAKNSRRGPGWSTTNSRPSRPISTVILDEKEKAMIVNDMNEFLHPNSPKWYATRGIPYRRGYLFHGPPGTGKTSLSFALAGIFGLDLYCFALNDPDLGEGDLRDLFNWLPRRCIVLLEDIDEAGIRREDHKKVEDDKAKDDKSEGDKAKDGKTEDDKAKDGKTATAGKSDTQQDTATHKRRDSIVNATAAPDAIKTDEKTLATETQNEQDPTDKKGDTEAAGTDSKPATAPPQETNWTLQDLARAIMKVSGEDKTGEPAKPAKKGAGRGRKTRDPFNPDSEDKNGISLSGLLNAIDGVATHEGRILIMTTNHPDELDEALVRTGRVDVRVEFTYASKAQIEELFLRMYAVDFEAHAVGTWRDFDLFEQVADLEKPGKDDIMRRLEQTAKEFADVLPDREFSPSDVQGYLLVHKKTPLKALKGAAEWRDGELKRKAEKKAKEKA